jgi:peptidoglycan L-alanyl-D-glutamate endopeptidase CwlK
MMAFILGRRSQKNLIGTHPDLARVVEKALTITEIDFGVIEGLRTRAKQKKLFDKGASTTMNSRHLTGHAVDLVALIDGHVRWDWALYSRIAYAIKEAAKDLNIPIEWGGDWKSFKDGMHFQLPWKEYTV